MAFMHCKIHGKEMRKNTYIQTAKQSVFSRIQGRLNSQTKGLQRG